MTLNCEEVEEQIRATVMDGLVTEVNKREDQFLIAGGDYKRDDSGWESWVERPELNPYAIAEWVYGLLERQRAAMIEVVSRELA